MFEGCNANDQYSLRIWKCGTVMNALFIGFIPQVILLIINFIRGVAYWDFLGLALRPEMIYENNDSLFKTKHGNTLFAIITGSLFLFLIIIVFFTEKIFRKHGIYCKCCSILCCPCPQNCINISQDLSSSQSLEIAFSHVDDGNENVENTKSCGTEIFIYLNGDMIWTTESLSAQDEIELNKVAYQCYYIRK